MNFEIHMTGDAARTMPSGHWAVVTGNRIVGDTLFIECWDEMLGLVASLLIGDPRQTVNLSRRPGRHVTGSQWRLLVTNVSPASRGGRARWWTIEREDRCVSHLTDHEALAWIAAYTFAGKELYGGLLTYEESRRRHKYFYSDGAPAALLTFQPLQEN